MEINDASLFCERKKILTGTPWRFLLLPLPTLFLGKSPLFQPGYGVVNDTVGISGSKPSRAELERATEAMNGQT